MSRLFRSIRVAMIAPVAFLAAQIGALAYENPAMDRGAREMSHRDYDGAINSFGEAIGFDMNNTEAYFKRGQCFYHMKNYQSAMVDFKHLLDLKPKDAQAMLWAGTTQSKLGDDKAAVDFYLRAMRADPQLVKQYQQATPAPGTITPKNEGSVRAYEEAVRLYMKEGNNTLVVDPLSSKKSDISPSGMGADSTLKEPQLRIEELNAAIQSDPSNATLFFKRARVHKRLGDIDKALADFTEAIRLDPMQARFYLGRARLYHEQHQPVLANADVTKAQNVDPKVPRNFKFANKKEEE